MLLSEVMMKGMPALSAGVQSEKVGLNVVLDIVVDAVLGKLPPSVDKSP